MKKHKIISLISIIAIMCITLGFSAFANDSETTNTANNSEAVVLNDPTEGRCGENVGWIFDEKAKNLIISGSGDMYSYEFDNQPWKEYEGEIKVVTVSDGVTSIGDFAFYQCEKLESVMIGKDLNQIGEKSLYAPNLATIEINEDNTVFSSENGVFYDKTKTTILACPATLKANDALLDTVETIAPYAFYKNTATTELKIPDTVEEIGLGAFEEASLLNSVTFGKSLRNICDYAFYKCVQLANIELSDNLKTIGQYAFAYCENLKFVLIPNNVKEIKEGIFECCYDLNSIVIGSGITAIPQYTFFGCESLQDVRLGQNIQTIGSSAFAFCSSLKTIVIPDNIYSISEYAFTDCTELTSAVLSQNLKTVGKSAFENCISLKSVNLSKSVSEIAQYAFGYYYNPETNSYSKVPNFVVYGYKNTLSQSYANSNGLTFGYLDEPTDGDWVVNENNQWSYVCDGKPLVSWQDNLKYWQGNWFYFDENGIMKTGWQFINNVWYYMADNGTMCTGKQFIDGCWYYMNENGAMQVGWCFIDDKWYYMNQSGAMQIGWHFINGKWYYMDINGVMQIGWIDLHDGRYYLNEDGSMASGWVRFIDHITLEEYWHYLGTNGLMWKNTTTPDGYLLDENGVWKNNVAVG